MIRCICISILIFCCCSSAHAESMPEYENIFGYSELSFDTAVMEAKKRYDTNPIEANKITYESLLFLKNKREKMNDVLSNSVLVYFYLPNCPHCEQFEPKIAELKKLLGEQRIVSVNANESAYTQHFNLTSAPSLVAFWKSRDNKKEEFVVLGGKELTVQSVIVAYKKFVYKILKSEFVEN